MEQHASLKKSLLRHPISRRIRQGVLDDISPARRQPAFYRRAWAVRIASRAVLNQRVNSVESLSCESLDISESMRYLGHVSAEVIAIPVERCLQNMFLLSRYLNLMRAENMVLNSLSVLALPELIEWTRREKR